MESLTAGTAAGAGAFHCERCGYVLSLEAADSVPRCPSCGGESFHRASLFAAGLPPGRRSGPGPLDDDERRGLLELASGLAEGFGCYLAYHEAGELRVVALAREWTRIGRSLAADVRFDDPTVSRRHALIVRQPDGVRVLDDRSLNGVFVNGERVEWRTLRGGDEIVVGRHRLHFLEIEPTGVSAASSRPASTVEANAAVEADA